MLRSMLTRRPSAAGIVAVVALVLAMGGTATAAKLISGKQIRNSSVTGKDIRNGSLGPADLSGKAKAALAGTAGPAGPAGPAGAPGAAGAKGEQGDRGPSKAFAAHVADIHNLTVIPATHEILGGSLDDGSYVITAKFQLRSESATDGRPNCQLGVLRGGLFDQIDQVNLVHLGAENSDTDAASYVLTGIATVDAGDNPYLVKCTPAAGQDLSARDRTLTAIQVGELG